MVDRQDIDALLIGSLYGELSSTDEARLQTHLESHPSDRSALADLTRAREVVRESRLLQVQVDPPPSITALLIQEAARRAPRPAPEHSWFQRFMRSFMLHPAMAAAATLVLVVGVASTMYLRGGDQFASQTKAPPAVQAPASPPATERISDQRVAPSPSAPEGGERAGSAQYPVTLDGEVSLDDAVRGDKPAEPRRVESKADFGGGGRKGGDAVPVAKAPPKKSAPGRGYLELSTNEQAPKDFDKAAPAKPAKQKRSESVSTPADFGGMAVGGASGANEPAPATEPAPKSAQRAPAPTGASQPEITSTSLDRSQSAKSDSRPAPPPPPPASAEPIAQDEKREEKPDPELAWAKAQHGRIAAQVRSGNCQSAASLAVALSDRAPAYYAQHVENDRNVRQCLAYITAEREKQQAARAQRARASKRAGEEPARTAPAETSK